MAEVKTQSYKDFYQFFNVSFTRKVQGSSIIGNCPQCGAPKWSMTPTTGMYQCWDGACGHKGNAHSFLTWLQEQGNASDIHEIAEERGLPESVLLWTGLFKHGLDWYLPVFGNDGKLKTIKKWVVTPKGNRLYNPPNLEGRFPLQLFQLVTPTGPYTKVYLFEGEWDAIAALASTDASDPSTLQHAIWAVPGCNIFDDVWKPQFLKKDVVVCYDNDKPGKDGAQRVKEKLGDIPSSVRSISWPKETPDKFDVRDLYKTKGSRVFEILDSYVPAATNRVAKIIRKHPSELIKDMERVGINHNPQFLNCFWAGLATVYASRFKGDPLWMYNVGPAGSGKTLIANALRHIERCVFQSSVRANSLVSGRNGDNGEDPSLLNELNKKCLVCKDWTEILDMASTEQDAVLSVFRGAYDRVVERRYGNGVIRRYEVEFTIWAGVTDAIYQVSQAALGERFLKIHMLPKGYDPNSHILAAIQASQEHPDLGVELSPYVAAYMDHLFKEDRDAPQLTPKQQEDLVPIVRSVAGIRAAIGQAKLKDEPLSPPLPEIGTRTGTQLQKLCQTLCIVQQRDAVDLECFRVIRRVARDTIWGYHSLLCDKMLTRRDGYSLKELVDTVALTETPTRNKLFHLKNIGLVQCDTDLGKVNRGSPRGYWSLTPAFRDIWSRALLPR